nr:RecX family transcriptional regulator [Haliscomenobacter sp.]
MQKPFPGREIALQKLQRYCAFQERCYHEVRQKLYELSVYGDLLEEIVAELISDNFLNEERFTRTYARGKFRTRSWGASASSRN